MRSYAVMPLHFRTPVHFGDAGSGGGLEAMRMTCPADTFFAALCREAAAKDLSLLEELVQKAESGAIAISDLLPWRRAGSGTESEIEWYLPRPMYPIPAEKQKVMSYEEVKADSAHRKAQKKRAFIRASDMAAYVEDCRTGSMRLAPEPVWGTSAADTHFNGRSRSPYSVGGFYFAPDAGLYVIAAVEEEADAERLASLIELVGLGGIGGRRASGLGKYEPEDSCEWFFLEDGDVQGKDDAALYQLLTDTAADVQMALSVTLPAAEEIGAAAAGSGKLLRRSGFGFSPAMGRPIKMDSVYMMCAGSCFKTRLAGRIADVNYGQAPHPVYKYGKGLYAGIRI